ncbi:MAG TPA: AbrB/MazE/SpoVT family DNA-binding domain-containing protein [Candidatus Lokiarchaeia archaeon]|nr:AbrB/MazE/SpoVT family DNA-binding domain-containing protein [Candidatus Lokiarchaeia archaeon]
MEIAQTDASGKLCLPEDVCQKLGLKPGAKFQVTIQGSTIILSRIEPDQSAPEDEETLGLMQLSEISLKDFLEEEPDLYTDADLKVKYQ